MSWELQNNLEAKKEIRKVYGDTLESLILDGKDIMVCDSDLVGSSGAGKIYKEYKDNSVNFGICEQNMIAGAASMSVMGYKPFVHSFSPFVSRRAMDTANIVLENRNISITSLKGLKEMSFGYLEGSDLTVPDSEMGKCWNTKDFTKYNGENRELFENRIRDTYQYIVDESKDGETILIVSHRGYFNYMLEALFNMDLDELERENPNYLETLIPNASVAKFYYEDDKYILEEMPR